MSIFFNSNKNYIHVHCIISRPSLSLSRALRTYLFSLVYNNFVFVFVSGYASASPHWMNRRTGVYRGWVQGYDLALGVARIESASHPPSHSVSGIAPPRALVGCMDGDVVSLSWPEGAKSLGQRRSMAGGSILIGYTVGGGRPRERNLTYSTSQ